MFFVNLLLCRVLLLITCFDANINNFVFFPNAGTPIYLLVADGREPRRPAGAGDRTGTALHTPSLSSYPALHLAYFFLPCLCVAV